MDQTVGDILVLPFFGQGHLFPCVELCKQLSSFGCKSVFIIPSHLSSSLPSTFYHHPLVEVLEIPASCTPLPPPPTSFADGHGERVPRHGHRPAPPQHHKELGDGIESFLENSYKKDMGRIRPGCVVIDEMMSWSTEIFMREKIPIVSFITSGACSTAVEYAAWKAGAEDMKPGETRMLSGLPESLALSYTDLTRKDHKQMHRGGPNRPHGRQGGMNFGPGPNRPDGRQGGMSFGPRKPGQPPRWLEDVGNWTAILLNTCNELEGLFLEYIEKEIEKPVFGIGPLLPETYWKSSSSLIRDKDSRPDHESNYKEDEVMQWLDSKPSKSVIYVSFGSEVGPTMEEYAQLADALAEVNQPFIWVIQLGAGKPRTPAHLFYGRLDPSTKEEGGYFPHGLQEKVGDRGLIIKGWAPQLLILSHPSTGGFLSHCGWNSTIEAIGLGVPILAWPIRGDQFYNAHLVVKYLRAGHTVLCGEDLSKTVQKSDIMHCIKMLMDDKEVQERAGKLRGIFAAGYPSSSAASLKACVKLIS